jgi:hypothetical protein
MESYSQCGQDLFVLTLLGKNGSFLDLGCYLPKKINNTYLLEENGWVGVSLDIEDYSKEWGSRRNKFLQTDCLSLNYRDLIDLYYPDSSNVIDYLSIDMESIGDRYKALEMVMSSECDFKIITIEHDSHLGENYVIEEKNKQSDFLKKMGYHLLCDDVSNYKNPEMFYEDWWINPKYLDVQKTGIWESKKSSCDQIFSKVGIDYTISEISKNWDDYKIN